MKRVALFPLAALAVGILFCGLLVVGSSAAQADFIRLKNGKTLEGALLDLGNGKVRIDLTYGSLTMAASQVEEVRPALTLEDSITQELEALAADDAAGRFRLAERARLAQSYTLHRRLLEAVLTADPEHEAARRQLGYVPFEGSWVTQEQFHELKGEVLFRGEWVSSRQRDQILGAEEERRSQLREEIHEQRRQQARALAEARIRELEEAAAEARQRRAAPTFVTAFAQPGCGFGGVNAYLPGFSAGPVYSAGGFQTLEPFQPGQIQLPRQNYNYSFLQVHRTRGPRPLPLPRSGYRRDFLVANPR
jgi:hypothetical protein